jgi:hypothetical protein
MIEIETAEIQSTHASLAKKLVSLPWSSRR